MPQLFRPRANALTRTAIFGSAMGVLIVLAVGFSYVRSPYSSGRQSTPQQPVPFSHGHHAGELGLDCRYCHDSVENSAFAGMPTTETCMTCHSQLWTEADMLKPVRDSFARGEPLRWVRVHDLPKFVYFNHGIHVAKGVGCATCHGRIDRMAMTEQTPSLFMSWCLACHRAPEQFVRPREHVFDVDWQPAESQEVLGPRWVKEYGIRTDRLTDCYTCHR